jgi:hypothetical protein
MDNYFSSFIVYLYPPCCCLPPRQWRFSTTLIFVHKVTKVRIGGICWFAVTFSIERKSNQPDCYRDKENPIAPRVFKCLRAAKAFRLD